MWKGFKMFFFAGRLRRSSENLKPKSSSTNWIPLKDFSPLESFLKLKILIIFFVWKPLENFSVDEISFNLIGI